MKLIVNTTTMQAPLTGVGNYTWQLCRQWARKGIFQNLTYFIEKGFHLQKEVEMPRALERKLHQNAHSPSRTFLPLAVRKLAWQIRARRSFFKKDEFRLYFEPSFIPLPVQSRHLVVTVHDFAFERFPEYHNPDFISYFKLFFWKGIERAHKIITVSSFVRDEAIQGFGISPDKIAVIPNGIDHDLFFPIQRSAHGQIRKKHNLPKPFYPIGRLHGTQEKPDQPDPGAQQPASQASA